MIRCACHIVTAVLGVSLLGACHASLQMEDNLIFSSTAAETRVVELRRAIDGRPGDPNCHLELGRIFLSEGYPKIAIHEFEEVLTIDSRHVQAHLLLALALQKPPKPNPARATELLEAAVRIAPHDAQVHLSLAQIYDEQGLSQKAAAEFEKAIEASKDPAILVSSHLGLMALYRRQGDLGKAEEEYEAAYRIYPGVKDMLVRAQISRSTPPPQYPNDPRHEGKGHHPRLETRMQRLREAISALKGGQK